MMRVNGTKLNKYIKFLAKLEGNNILISFFLNTTPFATPTFFRGT